MDTLISIIIPAYNIENYLAATLDSVLAQTYTNLEVIVVDDGSSDGTTDIADDYAVKDCRIKVIHKSNGGVTSARLRGIAESHGEWIGFVDGDDFVEPEMYEQLLNNAIRYDADISHCGYQMVFPNGRIDYYHNSGKLTQQDRICGLINLLSGEIEPGLWNKLYHKSLIFNFVKNSSIPADIKINEDVLMNYYLFKEASASVYEDICPYHYVLRKGSAATSKLNKHKLWDPIRVTKIILEDADDVLQNTLYARLVRQLISLSTMSLKQNRRLIISYRKSARTELREQLSSFLQANIGAKLKIMALWAAIWPASYGWVHSAYLKITGLDKIYDLE